MRLAQSNLIETINISPISSHINDVNIEKSLPPARSIIHNFHNETPDKILPAEQQPRIRNNLLKQSAISSTPPQQQQHQYSHRSKNMANATFNQVTEEEDGYDEEVPQHHPTADDDRRSLTNFEEFEKSMSLLENEKEFEDMLNSFADKQTQRKSEKMRQSLDHIKKRHLQINYERQQEEQHLKKKEPHNHIDHNIICDSNKLNESINNKSMISSTGSGERLLRRSRLFDDISPALSQFNSVTMDKSTELNDFNIERTVENDCNIGNNVDAFAGDDDDEEGGGNCGGAENHISTENVEYVDKSNRDRFKTIRLSKRSLDHHHQMLPPHQYNNVILNTKIEPHSGPTPSFVRKDINSPVTIVPSVDNKVTGGHHKPSQMIARPRHYGAASGIAKFDLNLKSNSVDSLAMRKNTDTFKVVPQSKNPTINKAKSTHSLIDNNASIGYKTMVLNKRPTERYHSSSTSTSQTTLSHNDPQDGAAFKMPQAIVNKRPTAILQQRSGLVRPSSGYFSSSSYNLKRNDSDTESGRFSPNNVSHHLFILPVISFNKILYFFFQSLSSGSSKNSLYKADEDNLKPQSSSNFSHLEAQRIPTATMTSIQQPSQSFASAIASNVVKVKRSGLQQPMQIKRSGLPRPKSTMANR